MFALPPSVSRRSPNATYPNRTGSPHTPQAHRQCLHRSFLGFVENCIFLDDGLVQLQNFLRFRRQFLNLVGKMSRSLRDCFSELSFWRCMSSGPRLFTDFLIVLRPFHCFIFWSPPVAVSCRVFLFSKVLQSLAVVLCRNLGLHLHHVDSSQRNFIIARRVITAGSKKILQTTIVEHRPRGTGNDDSNRSCARVGFFLNIFTAFSTVCPKETGCHV